MESEIWKVVGTLIVGVLLWRLQLGGRRRRLRHDIREEIELIALIDEHSEVQKRLRDRVKSQLEKYAPEQPKDPYRFLDIGIALALTVAYIVIVVSLVGDLEELYQAIVGVSAALVFNISLVAIPPTRRWVGAQVAKM